MYAKSPTDQEAQALWLQKNTTARLIISKTIGVSSNPIEIEDFYFQGKRWVSEQTRV